MESSYKKMCEAHREKVSLVKQKVSDLNMVSIEDEEADMDKEYLFLYQNEFLRSFPIKKKDRLYFSVNDLLFVRVNSVLSV